MPISFLAAVQIGLFGKIGDLAHLPVATGAFAVRAIWLPACFLAITLCLFLVEQREWMR